MSTVSDPRLHSARAYVRNEVARPGSTLYYSTLHLDPEDRDAVLCIFALRRALARIADERSDPVIAQAKLAWWSEELQRSARGAPTHPLTILLAASRGRYRFDAKDLTALAVQAAGKSQSVRIDDFHQLRAHCRAAASPFVRLLLHPDSPDPTFEETMISLVTALQLSDSLLELGHRARRGHVDLPLADFADAGLDPNDLLTPEPPPELSRLVGRHSERVADVLRRALDEFATARTPIGLGFCINAEITLRTLDHVRRDPLCLLRGTPELTPLRKLWIAWRTRRRADRSMRDEKSEVR